MGVNNTLSANTHIETDKLRARSDAGLLLQDDGGNGITISDGGNVEASHNVNVKGNSEFNGAISYFDSNFVHVLRPESSFYKSGNGTGYIKIKLPQSWTSNFLSFDVHVYQNTGDQNSQSFTLKVGGNNNNQSDSWQNVYAQLLSSNTNHNFNVRFGHDGDKCAIYIGESNSSWLSPLINLYNFSASYSDSSSTADHWNDGWGISIVSSLGTISKTSEAGLISTLLDVNSLSANNNYYITMTDLQDGKSKPFSSSGLYWDSTAANLSITGGVKVGSNLVIESDGYVPWNKSRILLLRGTL